MKTLNLKFGTALFAFVALSATAVNAQVKNNEGTLRTNVEPLTNSLSYISQLEPLSFKYNADERKKMNLPVGRQFGFLPEDVQKVLPAIVKTENKMVPAGKNAFRTTAVQNVDLESLIPVLVGSIKEQQAEIEKLKEEVRSLKSMASK